MESTEVIIARLVLGYLKREHCNKAYEQFLRTSVSLGEHSSNRSKFISTRFIGLTLEEILTEYFEISRIVQGRLEPTDYFIEGHSKTSLVKQLLYLLNKAHSSRASTPCPRSPLDSNLDETSPSYIDHISDVEATPAHSLPGNTQYKRDESYNYKSSRRKAQSKYVKVGPATSSPFMEKEDVSEIFAQTLLGKREFHEKIAQTINKVVEKQFKNSGELNETIKTVMKKTEEDPIFDRILEEIIGSSNHLDDDNGAFETGSTTSSNAHKTDRRSQETEADDENACRPTEYQKVDEQNNDAVQSIIASSKMNTNFQQVEEAPNNVQQVGQVPNNVQQVGQVPNNVQQMGQVPNNVQQMGQVPNTVQQMGQVPNNAQQMGQVPNNAQQMGQVPNNVQHVGQVPNNVPQMGQVPNNVQQVGQVPNNVQQMGQVPNNVQQMGQVPNNVQQMGQVPNNVQRMVQVPNNAQQMGQVPNNAQQMGQVPNNAQQMGQVPNNAQQMGQVPNNVQQMGQVRNNAQQMVDRQNNDVVIFDGSLDKYLRSDSSNLSVLQTQPVQNSLYINTTATATLFIPTNPPRYSINDSRQLMAQPTVSWNTPGIITESDILTMPTVILSDSVPNISDTSVSKSEPVSKMHLKPILPTTAMPRIEIAANLSEYLKLNDIGVVKPKAGLKKVHYPKSTPTVTSAIPTTLKNTKEIIPETVTLANSNFPKPSGEKKEPKREQAPGASMPTTFTPPPHQQIKKATPKSGSHVRNLDFSSPPRITSTHKKTARSKLGSKSPQFVHKKQAAKLLFKESGVWDADLRAICPQGDKHVSSIPKEKRVVSTGSIKNRTNKKETLNQKRKRVSCGDKKTKKRVKITKVLNTTEQFAAQVEAALESPVKKEEPKELEKNVEKPKVPTNSDSKKRNSGKGTVVNQKPIENKQNKRSTENNVTEQNMETPETLKEIVAHPIKANRNIMPLLETPLKDNAIPKTPGLSTPSDMNMSALNFTPFTKMLEDNLKGIDIDSLPTPSMPITPNFPPFTPTVDLVSPFSNRPTDYSTSSSYYQPSDNEQNKSLEAQLREAEKKSPIMDKMKSIFNKNVIGKKNLNLMRRDTTKSPDTSSTSTSISEDDSNSLWGEKESNDTVILKKKDNETPRRMYSLRNRSVSLDTAKKDSKNDSRKVDATDKRNSDSKKGSKNSNRDEETVTKELEVRNKKSIQKIKKITVPAKENEGKSNLKKASYKTGLKTSNKKKIVFESEEINQETKSEGKEEQENMKKTFSKTKKLSTAKQEKLKRLSVEVPSSEAVGNKLKEAVSKSGHHEYDEKIENAPGISPVADNAANKDVEDTDKSTKVIQNTVEVSETQEKSKSSTIGKEVETAAHKDLKRSIDVVQKIVKVAANSERGQNKKSFTTSEKFEDDVTEDLCKIAMEIQNTMEMSSSLEMQEKQELSTTSKGVNKDLSNSSKVEKSVDVSTSSETGEKEKSVTFSEDDSSNITKDIQEAGLENQEKRGSTTTKDVKKDPKKNTKAQKTVEVSASFEKGEKKKPSTTREKVKGVINRDLGQSTKLSASSEIHEKKETSTTSKEVKGVINRDLGQSRKLSASSDIHEKKETSTTSKEVKGVINRDLGQSTKLSASSEIHEKKDTSTTSKEVKGVINRDLGQSTKLSASSETHKKKETSTTSKEVKGVINRDLGQSTKLSASSEKHENKETSTTSKEVKDENRASIMADPPKADKETSRVPYKAKLDKKSSVLKELEEKRQRTINKLKKLPETKDTTTSKKHVNGKFKIKPIPNVTCVRKKPRKSDSPMKRVQYRLMMKELFSSGEDSDDLANDTPVKPSKDESKNEASKTENVSDKSESDVEAQNLIEGLKERGIHLMHNKSPKKKVAEDIKEECTTAVDSPNCSSSRIDTFVRDTYDTKCFEVEDEHIIFDEEKVIETSNSYRTDEHAPQTFIGKVYLEGLGEEVDVPLTFTPFESLLEIMPEENSNNAGDKRNQNLSKKIIIKEMVIIKDDNTYERILNNDNDNKREDRNRGCIEGDKSNENAATAEDVEQKPKMIRDYDVSEQMRIEDDDLMNFASTGKEKDFQERSQSPTGTKKRKLSDGNNHHTEKKAKRLLKNLDVDTFLNNIHHAGPTLQLKK